MSHTHKCCGCLSRRQCLQYLSASAVSATLGVEAVASPKRQVPADPEPIDAARLRPKPRVTVEAAILQMPRPYWLGWPGTTYDLDAHQKEYRKLLGQSCTKLGVTLREEAKPIQDEAGFGAWLTGIKSRKPDAVLVILQHMSCWGWAERLSQEAGVPLIVFSPVGTSFTGHVIGISRRRGTYVVSSLEWSAVEDGLRMVRAQRMFEESRILWVQGGARNETVLERLGTKVRAIPRDTFNQLFAKIPATDEVKDTASTMRKHAKRIIEPTPEDSLNSARAYVTAKRLMLEEDCNALSMDCLGMVGMKLVPTPPCGAWTLLQDEGVTCGCEADLFGATSLMLTSYLLDRPGYMNDPVAETAKNLLITSHCTSGTKLSGFDKPAHPYILRDHSESKLGVSVQVLWPVAQPVTLVRFTGPNEIIVDTGTVVSNVNTPPAGGCRTSVEVKMDNVEDARDVSGFHQVVTLGNHKRILDGFAQMYGYRIVRSPERAPRTEA